MIRYSKYFFGILLAIVLVLTTTTTAYAKSSEWKEGSYMIETTYAGTIEEPNAVENWIERTYGSNAKALYIQGVQTGDYVPFRQATGIWEKTNVVRTSPTTGMNFSTWPTPAEVWQGYALRWFGGYGTVQDYITWCQSNGYDPNNSDAWDMPYILGQKAMPAKITKKQYQANHKASNTATAPAASNSQVDALKTYSGNDANFNAYYYYTNYSDLQSAFGADGKALKNHWTQFGKKEGRIANKLK